MILLNGVKSIDTEGMSSVDHRSINQNFINEYPVFAPGAACHSGFFKFPKMATRKNCASCGSN